VELTALVERVDGFLAAMESASWPDGLEMPVIAYVP
jgi:hypothetical protein